MHLQQKHLLVIAFISWPEEIWRHCLFGSVWWRLSEKENLLNSCKVVMHTNLSLMASQTFQNLKRSFFLFPFFVSLFFSADIKSYGQISQLQRVTGWPKRHARYTVRWTALSSDLTWLFSVPRNSCLSWPIDLCSVPGALFIWPKLGWNLLGRLHSAFCFCFKWSWQ